MWMTSSSQTGALSPTEADSEEVKGAREAGWLRCIFLAGMQIQQREPSTCQEPGLHENLAFGAPEPLHRTAGRRRVHRSVVQSDRGSLQTLLPSFWVLFHLLYFGTSLV
eukprot:Gb_03193 [translate_table: standard]